MALEVGTRIADLVATNPLSSDPAGQGDDHLRLLKACIQGSMPNMGGILGQVRSQDTAVSLSSAWNTSHILVSNSATATVVLTLPPAASITTGFYLDILTLAGANVSLLPSGVGVSINGAASLAIPPTSFARVAYDGADWWAAVGQAGGNTLTGPLVINGAVSISGAVTLASTLTVSAATTLLGTLSVSGASVLTGAAAFRAAVTMDNTLSVSGAAHMKTTLSVGGATVLAGAATLAGALSVSGAVNFNTTLNVQGATTLSGATTMKGVVSIGGAATLGSTLTVSGTVVFVGLLNLGGNLNLNNGTINFPAVQNPSAGANTLDDYEEGTWTPFIDYAVTGNLNVVFSTQSATYTKIGRLVTATFTMVTTTYTHTTASGSMVVSGFPFTPSFAAYGTLSYEGMAISTGANFDGPILRLASGSAAAAITKSNINSGGRSDIDQNSHVSGTNVSFDGTISYNAS